MRRTKQGVLSDRLPKKTYHIERVEMTPWQLRWYESLRRAYRESGATLAAIQQLRMVCDHTHAVNDRLLETSGFPSRIELLDDLDAMRAGSAKLVYMERQLAEIERRGERALIFAWSKELQRILQAFLRLRFGLRAKIVNGDTPGPHRQQIIDELNSSSRFGAVIMGPKAAGVGLTATGANHVFHMSREWNPAREDQATDRAYRIGQHRDVHVYIPVVTHPRLDSLDVLVDKLLTAKAELARNVLIPTKDGDIDWQELTACLNG